VSITSRARSSHSSIATRSSPLTNLLQFSPLAESEFDVIVPTGAFHSPMRQVVAEFIAASETVLVKKQDDV
jgi:hypothetical protein